MRGGNHPILTVQIDEDIQPVAYLQRLLLGNIALGQEDFAIGTCIQIQPEEKRPLQVGDYVLVHVYLDPRSRRITATARLDRFLDNSPATYQVGEQVELLIAERTDLGFKAIINERHWGLLHKNELFRFVRSGMRETGYIREVRDDGKINLSLQPVGAEQRDVLAERIVEALQAAGGFLPLSDKSPAELISQQFSVSKGNFKKAIGGLYKRGVILIGDDGIRLAP